MSTAPTITAAPPMMVAITYDIVTPESAEDGDTVESGFERMPQAITPADVMEALNDHDTVEDAVHSLIPCPDGYSDVRGAFYAGNAKSFYACDSSEDYRTGESTTYAIHLTGWPPALLEVAARILTGK